MTLRKTLLVALMGMLLAGLSAISLEDLENDVLGLYSPTVMAVTLDDGTEDYEVVPADAVDVARADSIFAAFLEEPLSAKELEEAAGLWKDYNPDGYKAWIEARTSDPAAPLQVFYLWFKDQEDPLSRINAARQLITNYPDQVYGYRLMLLAYFDKFPLEYNFDDAESVQDMWQADLPHMLKYHAAFPGDEYHRLAGILALNGTGKNDEASDVFSQAYLAGDIWLDEIIPSRLQPIEQYHGLLFSHYEMIFAQEDDWVKSEILSEIRADLVPYYFEDDVDYNKVIFLLTTDEEALEDYYNRFALVSSLYKTGDAQLIYKYLVDKDNLAETVAFQDAWINYDPADAKEVYTAALIDLDAMLARYLLSRVGSDRTQSIKDARAMLQEDSRGLYGYLLLADTYWNYFANAAAEDPARADWIKWLKQDNGRLRAYFIRFPEDLKAQAAYMLTLIIGKNDERAFKYYQMILNQGPFSNEVKLTDKIIADTGNFKLLWDAKVAYIAEFIEQGYLEEADRAMYEVVGYCSALYSNGYFSKLTEEVYKNPNWLDYQDIQYMTVNSHYQLQEFGEVIDILRLMLERGTISLDELQTLQGQPISEHPNWKSLIEYASQLAGTEAPAEPPADFASYPAPLWTLPDAEGNLISLEDLRGQIVILDFWATWCGPCKSAMPLLNDWMATEMPEGVRVFSINVWESDIPGVIKFMNDNKYKMHLLFGDDSITEAYGIQGIPFICVIDADGIIRGVEKGYSPTLKDRLNAWIDEINSN